MNDYVSLDLLAPRELRERIRLAKSEYRSAEQRWNSTSNELEKRALSDDFDFMRSLREELFLLEYELEELELEIEILSNALLSRNEKSRKLSNIEEVATADVIDVQLSEKLLRRLNNISEYDLSQSRTKSRIRIYIFQVSPVTPTKRVFDFYVGTTGNDIEKRLEQHLSGGKLAWKELKSGRETHEITWYRWDLFGELPEFASMRAAHKAEGLVADFLNRRGFAAYSDQTNEAFKKGRG